MILNEAKDISKLKTEDLLSTLNFIKSNSLVMCGVFDGYYSNAQNPYYIKFVNVVNEINPKVKSALS